MKQLAGRGGGFFVAGKRIRGFGLGPPGMDDGRFFYEGGMGPDFGGRYPPDFFPGGPGPNMSFNPLGTISFYSTIFNYLIICIER